ncbi:MAG TPA: hypothetical protein VMB20_11915 [Candidatus Acidoferrum sp.]|nr:hypothetical protein [Candidatus Acidoferrum sp.]
MLVVCHHYHDTGVSPVAAARILVVTNPYLRANRRRTERKVDACFHDSQASGSLCEYAQQRGLDASSHLLENHLVELFNPGVDIRSALRWVEIAYVVDENAVDREHPRQQTLRGHHVQRSDGLRDRYFALGDFLRIQPKTGARAQVYVCSHEARESHRDTIERLAAEAARKVALEPRSHRRKRCNGIAFRDAQGSFEMTLDASVVFSAARYESYARLAFDAAQIGEEHF